MTGKNNLKTSKIAIDELATARQPGIVLAAR
jgi:hypothetical protein